MKFVAALALTVLLGATGQATPTQQVKRQNTEIPVFVLQALRSASPIHFGPINAADGKFWIWGPSPKTSCYPTETSCGKINITTIDWFQSNSRAGLYSLVPGGQDAYVAPDGSLSFTEPHLEGVFPPGSIATGFTYTPPPLPGRVALFNFIGNGSTGFTACPSTGDYPWQIYADIPSLNLPSDCLPFGASAGNFTGGPIAYQYD